MKTPINDLMKGLENEHPAAYYTKALKLFEAGEKDEAVFCFYAGQLRYRYHLAANPKLDPSGDPALFASLSAQVGTPLNQYAFGDIPKLAKTIDLVLAWDDETPNGFTAKTADAAQYRKIREGLGEMKAYVLANQAQIKEQRKAAGLD